MHFTDFFVQNEDDDGVVLTLVLVDGLVVSEVVRVVDVVGAVDAGAVVQERDGQTDLAGALEHLALIGILKN